MISIFRFQFKYMTDFNNHTIRFIVYAFNCQKFENCKRKYSYLIFFTLENIFSLVVAHLRSMEK